MKTAKQGKAYVATQRRGTVVLVCTGHTRSAAVKALLAIV